MHGVSTYTCLDADALSLFLGFILEYRISALPKTFLIAFALSEVGREAYLDVKCLVDRIVRNRRNVKI